VETRVEIYVFATFAARAKDVQLYISLAGMFTALSFLQSTHLCGMTRHDTPMWTSTKLAHRQSASFTYIVYLMRSTRDYPNVKRNRHAGTDEKHLTFVCLNIIICKGTSLMVDLVVTIVQGRISIAKIAGSG
jgi:hypothetical protein